MGRGRTSQGGVRRTRGGGGLTSASNMSMHVPEHEFAIRRSMLASQTSIRKEQDSRRATTYLVTPAAFGLSRRPNFKPHPDEDLPRILDRTGWLPNIVGVLSAALQDCCKSVRYGNCSSWCCGGINCRRNRRRSQPEAGWLGLNWHTDLSHERRVKWCSRGDL